MTDELQLRQDMTAANEATRVMKEPAIVAAFAQMQSDYFEAWKASPADAIEARERLWQAAAIIETVKAHLEMVISSGQLAKEQLDQIAATPSSR